MSVPTSVLALLDSQNVPYQVSLYEDIREGYPPAAGDCVVKSMLLEDGLGRVQVLFSSDRMIDLDAMFHQFGRQFQPLGAADLRPLIHQHELTTIPAVPRWQGMPTIVDEALLTRRSMLLESGSRGHFVTLTREAFEHITDGAETGIFTRTIPNYSVDSSEDKTQIFNSIDKFTERRIRQRLDETLELPPLPETAQRIIKLRADPNADISGLAHIVELDPSLAAQVVSWAGSPYYSAPGKIKSVHDAIVRVLGFDMVLNLSLGLALGRTFATGTLNRQEMHQYWRSAVFTAAAVEALVTSIERKHRPGFGMAYLSGLLHNFGFLILADVFPPYFKSIQRLRLANPHVATAAIEHHIIGVTSAQISSWLFNDWGMPEEVVLALRQQHNARYQGDHSAYSKLVNIAQFYLAQHGFSTYSGGGMAPANFAELRLEPEAAKTAVATMLESGEDLEAIADQMRNG